MKVLLKSNHFYILKKQMGIKVYDGEHFERGKTWYIVFVSLICFVIILSIFMQNYSGVVVLFLLLGGYILFHLLMAEKKIMMSISDEGLKVGGTIYPRNKITGFVLEIDTKTQLLKNIVLIIGTFKSIHTFCDENIKIKEFILKISDIIPMNDSYDQTVIEKIAKKLKL